MLTNATQPFLRRRPLRRAFGAAAWLGLVALLVPDLVRAQVDEYGVKAALLYHFTQFLEWPEESFAGSPQFRICIFGEDPFGAHLDAVAHKRTGGRPIVVRRYERVGAVAGRCEIAFIAEDRAKAVGEALRSFRSEATLTVGDGARFVDRGGMIGLVREGSKIRFEINLAETRRAGLSVSARLLRVAQRVVE